MVRRHNRLLVAFHVGTDAVLGMVAFVFAYLLRFETGLITITRGHPPVEQYLNVLPFIAIIVPLGFHFQGLYRLRRGRSRIDDFFNVLVGSIFAVVLGVVATLYFQAYYASDQQRDVGAYEVSRIVWGIFLVVNIALGYLLLLAESFGFATSPMLGFDPEKVKALLDLPAHVKIPAIISIGYAGEEGARPHRLSEESLVEFR